MALRKYFSWVTIKFQSYACLHLYQKSILKNEGSWHRKERIKHWMLDWKLRRTQLFGYICLERDNIFIKFCSKLKYVINQECLYSNPEFHLAVITKPWDNAVIQAIWHAWLLSSLYLFSLDTCLPQRFRWKFNGYLAYQCHQTETPETMAVSWNLFRIIHLIESRCSRTIFGYRSGSSKDLTPIRDNGNFPYLTTSDYWQDGAFQENGLKKNKESFDRTVKIRVAFLFYHPLFVFVWWPVQRTAIAWTLRLAFGHSHMLFRYDFPQWVVFLRL